MIEAPTSEFLAIAAVVGFATWLGVYMAARAPQVPEAGSSPIAEADASVAAIPQAEPLRNIG